MRVIGALAAGIAGAEGGTAEIYQRGTAQRAVLYRDFEALESTLVSPVTLSAYGRATLYVNEYVDVVVKDSSGQEQARWTEGDSSAAVEVRSDKFTGVDYETALTGPGKPVTLIDVLELLKTEITNVDTELDTKLSPFFNVKDPAYGALGNGTHDDSPHIALAVAAAEAAGGGIVFFPSGTYRLATAKIAVTGLVSLLGCGSRASKIVIDAAVNDDAIAVTLALEGYGNSVQGLAVNAASTLAKAAVYVNGGTAGGAGGSCRVVGCSLNDTGNLAGGVLARGCQETIVSVEDCDFEDGTGSYAVDGFNVDLPLNSPHVLMRGGNVRISNTTKLGHDVLIIHGAVLGVRFSNAQVTSSAAYSNVRVKGAAAPNGGWVLVDDCIFENASEALATDLYAVYSELNSHVVLGAGNVIGTLLKTEFNVGDATTTHEALGPARGFRVTTVSGADHTVYPKDWSTEFVKVDGGSFAAVRILFNEAPVGTRFTLMVENTHASTSSTITLAGITASATDEVSSVAAGTLNVWHFESVITSDGVRSWVMMSPVNYSIDANRHV